MVSICFLKCSCRLPGGTRESKYNRTACVPKSIVRLKNRRAFFFFAGTGKDRDLTPINAMSSTFPVLLIFAEINKQNYCTLETKLSRDMRCPMM